MRYVVYHPSYNFAEKENKQLFVGQTAGLKKYLSGEEFWDGLNAAPTRRVGLGAKKGLGAKNPPTGINQQLSGTGMIRI